jgi:hypothetical protein
MINYILEATGWIGSALVMWAYSFVALNKISPLSLKYKVANLIGGITLTIFSLYKESYPPAIVNFIWSVLAVIALFKKQR